MRKVLLNIEKTTSSNKPSAMGGLGKFLGYIITAIAWVAVFFQSTALEFDAAVEPSTGVKQTYRDRWETSLNDVNKAIAKGEKLLAKLQARLAANDISLKPKKHQRLLDMIKDTELDIERRTNLMKVLRKKLYK